jgi:hypothetical protein
MKRLVFAVATALMLAGASVFASQSGAKPPKPQAPAAAAKAPKPVSSTPAPKASAPKPVAPSSKPAPRMVNATQPSAPKPSAAKPPAKTAAPAPAPAQNAKAVKAEKPVVTVKADAKPPKADSKVKP